MSASTIRRLGLANFVFTVILLATGEILNGLSRRPNVEAFFRFYTVAAAFAVVGFLIVVRRPDNRVGWVVSVIGLLSAMYDASRSYGAFAPSAGWAVALGSWGWFPSEMLQVGVLPLVFPTGKLLSARWRPVLWLAATGTAAAVVVGFSGWRPGGPGKAAALLLPGLFAFAQLAFLVCLILALSSVVVRYRRAGFEERQQLKWFVDAVLLVILFLVGAQVVARVIFNGSPFDMPILDALIHLSFVAIPAAIGIAILKYRLYDIDLVINKTILFTAMAVFITAVYVAVVVGMGALVGTAGKPNLTLSIVATALVAIGFEPVRERVQRFANRLVYGERATPYEVLADFSDRMSGALPVEEVLPRIAEVAARGVGAPVARITQFLPDAAVRTVNWPKDVTFGGNGCIFPISHRGERIGELAIGENPGEPLGPPEAKLLADLAGQAGLVLHNVRLTIELQARLAEISSQAAQLRASRQRLLSAQDAERERLERTIRNGAERRLAEIASAVRSLPEALGQHPDEAVATLERLTEQANATLEELRDIARGVYPPLLREHGLRAALERQATKIGKPVTIDSDGIGRYPSEVEAAVYSCCLEAMRRASGPTEIRLVAGDGRLDFSIRGATPEHAVMQLLEDRVQALGGKLTAVGETLVGSIPLDQVLFAASQAAVRRSGSNFALEM